MVKTYTKDEKAVRLSEHFTVGELWLDQTMTVLKIDLDLVAALEKFYAKFGPPRFVTPRSIYCKTGHAGRSQHYLGKAADFSVEGIPPEDLAKYAEKLGMGGIGVYRNGRHIHMDTRSGKACWWLKTTGSKTPGFGGVPCVFKKGHRSPAIKDIQVYLNKAGYHSGVADGCWGANTDKAFRAWQKDNGMKADGAFGVMANEKMGLFDWVDTE